MLNFLKPFFKRGERFKVAILEPDSYLAVKKIVIGFTSTLSKNDAALYSFKTYNGFGNRERIEQAINEILADKNDLIFSIGSTGTVMLKEIISQRGVDIPVVFADVKDPLDLKLIDNFVTPGSNMTGVMSFNHNYAAHINHLLKLQPNIRRALIAYNPLQDEGLINSEKNNVDLLLNFSQIETHCAHILDKKSIKETVKAEVERVQPDVIITLRDGTAMAGMRDLIKVSQECHVPLFASDLESVFLGATFGSGFPEYETGYEGARQSERILLLKCKPGQIPLSLISEEYLVRVNKDALDAQGIKLSDEALQWTQNHGEMV